MSPTLPTGAAAGRMKALMVKCLDGDMSKMDIDDDAPHSAAPDAMDVDVGVDEQFTGASDAMDVDADVDVSEAMIVDEGDGDHSEGWQ